MESYPLVSVIIPVYNAASFIHPCLESVFAQSYPNVEVLVVDDGSSDESVKIVRGFEVQLLEQSNRGACAARNLGIRKASGEYIQFLDADDLLSPEKIQVQVDRLLKQRNAVANGRWGRFYSEDPWSESIQWGPDPSLQLDLPPVDWLIRNHMSQTACWLVPSSLVEKAGAWDETLSINQDGEFFSRVVAGAEEVLYTPEAKAYYRSKVSGSISSTLSQVKSIESLFKTCESYEHVLLELEDSGRTHRAIADKYQYFIFRTFPRHSVLTKRAEHKIRLFGGSGIKPYRRGLLFNLFQKLFGWKTMARLDLIRRKIYG